MIQSTFVEYSNHLQDELELMKGYINLEEVQKIIEQIIKVESNNGRVHVCGIGKPSYVAKYYASLLSSTGTPAYFLDGTEAIHGSSGQVKDNDIVFVISNSGETKELIATVQTLRNNGAYLVSCTGNDNSWISINSDFQLLAKSTSEGDYLNKPPRTSIILELTVLQYLSIKLQEAKKLDLEDYVRWHPGGALGKSIKEAK